ncbi:MAG: helix-turn-helix domain-containing protein [Verrucomicrobiota bacterium]
MNGNTSNERLLRFLQATPAQQTAIERILNGESEPPKVAALTGPLLLGMGKAASLLGVSRPTLWRMIKVGKLGRVEILPGSFRVRREELEAIANKQGAHV